MGENKVLLFLQKTKSRPDAAIECHQRLGGLLRYYHRKAAWAFDVAEQGRAVCFISAPLRPLDSAVLARGMRVVIPRFFYAAEIAAAMMLLFSGNWRRWIF